MNKVGRNVDISNINIDEIEKWTQNNKHYKEFIKCQSILSLHNGAQMKEVCNVLGITRETVRLWKEQLRAGGLEKLLKKGKVGKRSKLTEQKLKELKKVLKHLPAKFNVEGEQWTGHSVMQFVQMKWELNISLRTAYKWLNKARQ